MSVSGNEHNRNSFLFRKYLDGTCSNDEAQEIVSVLEDSGNDISLIDEANTEWKNINSSNNNNLKYELNTIEIQIIMDRILDRLHHRIRLQEEEISRKYSVMKFLTIFSKVAAVLILPLLVYSIYLTTRTFRTNSVETNQVVWQTVKTPVGMQTDFLLPDSSHVWLSSGSVFKYSMPFTHNSRQVELTGEAFFDVSKDSLHPFIVKAGKMNIAVKGTRFNVINYPDETYTELILESGSVRLFSGCYEDNKTIREIKPGQLVVFDNTLNDMSVSKVDVEKYTSWKEGILIFRDDKMDEVVRKLNRWFNVEIVLQSVELKEYVYTATYRDETLSQILELLKISAPIKYSITERERLPDNSYTKRKIVITKRK